MSIFFLIFQQGFPTKARSFFFKLYAGLVYGNSKLCLFGYSDSRRCERCDHPEQDLRHLLVECPLVVNLREQIYTKLRKNFSKQEELLGCHEKSYAFILLHINRFIYQRKFLKLSLSYHEFIAMLKGEMLVEETIATSNNSLRKYQLKWEGIKSTGIFD